MFRSLFLLLLAVTIFCSATAVPAGSKSCRNKGYPLAHNSTLVAHDPNILKHEGSYYLFKGGIGVPFYKAKDLNGPWEDMGTVLTEPSITNKGNPKRPWAPSVLERDGVFYCFYTLSSKGSQDSAIGVATSKELKSGTFKDHGAFVQTGTGPGAKTFPFSQSNAIDAHVFIDPKDDQPYLNYGSFWSGLWQVPLNDDLKSVKNAKNPDAVHLSTTKSKRRNDEEGGFMTYKEPYYYFWFSRGRCCHFDEENLDEGEYSIRVGRSKSAQGPFIDKNRESLTEGGGHVVYGSNHNKKVYAPGGLGVLSGEDGEQDILYYHFLNTRVGLKHMDAYMGWSYLKYINGWPVAKRHPANKSCQ